MKKIITLKVEEKDKTLWEQKALEKGLSLSEFIRQSVEGNLDQDFATKEDIDYLDKKISIVEKNILNKLGGDL